MGIDSDVLVDELREHLGVDIDDPVWSVPTLELLLNRALWEVMNKFNFRENESSYSFLTVIGQAEYDVPSSFEAMQGIGIQDVRSLQWTKLGRIDIAQYQDWLTGNTQDYAKPEKYFRRDDTITLWKTPDQVYNVQVYNLITIADISADPIVNLTIPQEWHEIILFGGLWRGYLKAGDMERSNQIKSQQVALINSTVPVQAKEETDSRDVGLSIRPSEPSRRRSLWR